MEGANFREQLINAERWYHAEVRRLAEQGFKWSDAQGGYVSPDGNTTVEF